MKYKTIVNHQPKIIEMSQLFYLFLCIICHLFFMKSSNGQSTSSNSTPPENCPITYCGEVKIRYPFWVRDSTLEITYCGYSGFGLQCLFDKKLAVFNTSNASYYVRSISYTDTSLTLVDMNAADQSCPRVQHNLTIETTTHLSYSQHDFNLSFYFNCSFPTELETALAPYRINCFESSPKPSYVVPGNHTDYINWTGICEDKVVAPVMETTTNLIDGFGKAINGGFSLDWKQLMDCASCEDTDGFCGHSYSQNRSLCFCPDNSTQPTRCGGKGLNYGLKILIGGGVLVVMAILMIVALWICSRKCMFHWKKISVDNQKIEEFIENNGFLAPKRYSFAQVKKMTTSFAWKLGQGGFGSVFKGKLKDGCPVAVKLLNASKGNGEDFINEVATISRTSHVNVVTLLGFCIEGHKRALIYEFMPNGSLEKFIYKENPNTDGRPLGWENLDEIAIGIARGLEYLHRGCNSRILHFDIKPHNILLDEYFCPKIADFGLAKLCLQKESAISMYDPRGTIGYVAPEMFSRNYGRVSHKSDVYSYGMMLLEMVGGRKNIQIQDNHTSEIYFPEWVYKRLEEDTDLGLQGIMNEHENEIARKMVIIGLWCIQTDPSHRPSITKVIEMLEGSIAALEIPPKPFLTSPPRSLPSSSKNFS